MTYSINKKGEFKEKRELDLNNYNYYNCGGSQGIELKHIKNGKKLDLVTEEFYETCCEEEYRFLLPKAYKRTYIKVEDLNKMLSFFDIF